MSTLQDLFAQAQSHHHARRLAEAREIYIEILRQDPRNADALNLLGALLAQQGQAEKAVDYLRRAIQIHPSRAPYHVNLGVVLQDLGRFDQAQAAYERAIKADKYFADSYYNLAKLFKQMELHEAALLAYEQVLSIDPNRSDALINMGNILFDHGGVEDSLKCFEKAAEINPNIGRPYINMGNSYRRLGEDQKAIQAYDQALGIIFHDGLRIKQATTLPVVCRSWAHIEEVRAGFEERLKRLLNDDLTVRDPLQETSTTNFFLAYHNLPDRELQELVAQVHLKSNPDLGFVAPHCRKNNKPKGRIKLGFISAYFRRHSIGRLMQSVISDISRDEFEVTVITQPGQRDAISRTINNSADHVLMLPPDLADARQSIAELELDILFYADIGMDVRNYYLAFARLAPVQCVTWGHPDTTGIPNIDYFVSSDLIEPDNAEEAYSEELYRLESLPTKYPMPEIPNPLKCRADFELEEGRRLYLCPQSAIKLHPDIDLIFKGILDTDDKAEIVIVEGAIGAWTQQALARMADSLGQDVDKINVVPRMPPEDFIALQAVADVILDTPHFSGGNTSFEAFALGKPVVTLDSAFMRGRVTAGMYRQMGVMDCVAKSLEGYIEIALKLGNDPEFRQKMESAVRENKDRLFDDPNAVPEFEKFFRWSIGQLG